MSILKTQEGSTVHMMLHFVFWGVFFGVQGFVLFIS
jgi:hypothetical protein